MGIGRFRRRRFLVGGSFFGRRGRDFIAVSGSTLFMTIATAMGFRCLLGSMAGLGSGLFGRNHIGGAVTIRSRLRRAMRISRRSF